MRKTKIWIYDAEKVASGIEMLSYWFVSYTNFLTNDGSSLKDKDSGHYMVLSQDKRANLVKYVSK